MEHVPSVGFVTKPSFLIELAPTVEIVPDNGDLTVCLVIDKNQGNESLQFDETNITKVEDEPNVLSVIGDYVKKQVGVKKPKNVYFESGMTYGEIIKQHAETVLAMTKRYIKTDKEYSGFYVMTKLVKLGQNKFEIQTEFTEPREGLGRILEHLEQVRSLKQFRKQMGEKVENSLLLILPASSREITEL